MTDALIAYGIAKIKEYGIVDSGDAKTGGIGAMTEARWRDFFDTMAQAGVYPAGPRLPQGVHLAIRQQESRDEALTNCLVIPAASVHPRSSPTGYAAGIEQALRVRRH